MITKDQIGISLAFDQTPQRIISLVPSLTELLVDLGLRDQIMGITKFCVHPQNLRKEKTVVGGTKSVSFSKIQALRPDIILCNKEENTQEMVLKLRELAPVHVSDIRTVEHSYELIMQYGEIFSCKSVANSIIDQIRERRSSFRESLKEQSVNGTVAYVIWKEPFMVAGQDTFINALLQEIGLQNLYKNEYSRYPEVSLESFNNADYIFLSSEPYPFSKKHIAEFRKYSDAKILLVNGEFFSWYGSRLIKAYSYFENLLVKLKL